MNGQKIFAEPLNVENIADCYFYHTMELPGYGVIEGRDWDLRGGVDEYLGNVAFAGQRVLEIGPASGFLTFQMEKRGADVVSVEVTAEHGWDFVPYPAARLKEVFGPRRIVMQQLKNSYWFSHAVLQSKARMYYGDVYNLPASLGQFDIAVMGSVLLHCRDPLRIIEQCAKMLFARPAAHIQTDFRKNSFAPPAHRVGQFGTGFNRSHPRSIGNRSGTHSVGRSNAETVSSMWKNVSVKSWR